MTRKNALTTTLLDCTLFTWTAGCGGNPVQATRDEAASVTRTSAAPPEVTAAPEAPVADAVPEAGATVLWTVTGGRHCEESPKSSPTGVYQWTLTVNDAGPSPLRVIAVSHHNDKAGCEATETRPGPLFRMTGTTDFGPHHAGQTILSYDTRDQKCGRIQVDASLLDSDGRVDVLIVGEVINYGADCPKEPPSTSPAGPLPPASPTPPAPPPPTVPPPSIQPMCPAADVIADVGFIKAGGSVTATFFVKPGVENAIISLATYRRDTPALLPQSMIAPPVSGVFSSGGPYTLSRPVSSCRAQVDLLRCVVANEPLTAENYSDLNSRTMAFWYDNTECL